MLAVVITGSILGYLGVGMLFGRLCFLCGKAISRSARGQMRYDEEFWEEFLPGFSLVLWPVSIVVLLLVGGFQFATYEKVR